jgi:hypothetical protein
MYRGKIINIDPKKTREDEVKTAPMVTRRVVPMAQDVSTIQLLVVEEYDWAAICRSIWII